MPHRHETPPIRLRLHCANHHVSELVVAGVAISHVENVAVGHGHWCAGCHRYIEVESSVANLALLHEVGARPAHTPSETLQLPPHVSDERRVISMRIMSDVIMRELLQPVGPGATP